MESEVKRKIFDGAEQAALEFCNRYGMGEIHGDLTILLRSREQAAYREGQERMRERAAEIVEQDREAGWAHQSPPRIRSLPIEDKEER